MPNFIYENNIIEYTLTRNAKRNVNFRIKTTGEVCISAPRYVSKAELEKMIQERAKWIVQNRNKIINQKKNAMETNIKNGSQIFLNGQKYYIKLVFGENNRIHFRDNILVFQVKEKYKDSQEYINSYFEHWIKEVMYLLANRMIDKLHEHHIKACIAIKPKTPVEAIIPFIDKLDMILVMTVEPGFGGQQMIESCLEKVRTIRQLNTDIDIEVDGGVNIETVKQVKKAGANVIVAGTAIFQSKNKEEMIKMFKN